jgi:hypothetical protein
MGWQLAAYDSKDEWLQTALPITRDQLVRLRDMFDRGPLCQTAVRHGTNESF